jgi:ATP-binding protein involved in chromosome partitioning
MTDTESITAALRTVTDPDIGNDVVSSGLVADVTVDGDAVTLSVELPGVDPDVAEEIIEEIRGEVLSLGGVSTVRVVGADLDTQTKGTDVGIGADRIVAVASAKGGVGKSTVATAMARGLAQRGEVVGVFDADIYGPNVPRLLDAEGPVVATADGHAAPVNAAGLEVMSIGLLENDAPIAWRGAMAHEALLDLLTDTAWNDLDTLVVDLPPGTGDIVLTTLQEVPVDGVVLVTTPYPTAIEDTGRSATLFEENGIPILGAVANMDGFTCPNCGDDHDLFDHEAIEELDLPVLAELPFDTSLRDPTGSIPDRIDELATRVQRGLTEAGLDVPDTVLDVRDLPGEVPGELVAEEFAALDSGEELWIRTDRDPETVLPALAGSEGKSTLHAHGACTCGHADEPHQEPSADASSISRAVKDVDIQRTGPEQWIARIERASGERSAAK